MAKKKDDQKRTKKSPGELHWNTSADAAHARDEREQTRDISRKSDSQPDDAEASMGKDEATALRMRSRNES